MKKAYPRIGYFAVIAVLGVYAVVTLRGPQGVTALQSKYREIQALQVENANLEKVNREKRERIEKLGNSRSQQELEIRKQLKYGKSGETQFVMPDKPTP